MILEQPLKPIALNNLKRANKCNYTISAKLVNLLIFNQMQKQPRFSSKTK